jgi:ubiquitin-protein ligase E3 C
MPDDYWVMSSQMDLQGFVEAAVYVPHRVNDIGSELIDRFEDSELATASGMGDDDSHIRTSTTLPSRMSARQRFTKRRMAFISPRLGLLNNLPMAVPFRTRLEVFRQFVA